MYLNGQAVSDEKILEIVFIYMNMAPGQGQPHGAKSFNQTYVMSITPLLTSYFPI